MAGIIKEVRPLSAMVYMLRAIAGMTAPGQSMIDPAAILIQTLIVQEAGSEFRKDQILPSLFNTSSAMWIV